MARETKPGANTVNGEVAADFIKRIEALEDEIGSVMGTAMAECKSLRDDIRAVVAEAKDKGIPIKPLKAEVKLRRLDRDKEKVVAGLEPDDQADLEMLREALGDFASLPLGQAALGA